MMLLIIGKLLGFAFRLRVLVFSNSERYGGIFRIWMSEVKKSIPDVPSIPGCK